MKAKLIMGVIFLLPVLIYVWQNSSPVPVYFLKWECVVPQALLVLGTLLVGVILGLFLSNAWRNKEKNKLKKADKAAEKLKKAEAALKKQQDKQHHPEEQKPVNRNPEISEKTHD